MQPCEYLNVESSCSGDIYTAVPKLSGFVMMLRGLCVQALRDAALDSSSNYVGGSGTQALAGLKDAA